ncbi:unnamed protein product [Eruca vesicaria subsp. sativa]|uniref:Uncharacterized protein n=1 Tax=Eruca vesicaria subsp. sativa TaxID=29727 RepID=A0ABC8M8I4_ERUVS|nr:unnamed protein product [Eruca vesicaria subsp. sativa]
MRQNQSENNFREGGGGGGGVRGKSMSSEDVYTRSQLESFFARRMAENESKPEGCPPSQGGKYVGFGSSSGPARMSNQQDDVFSVMSQVIWMHFLGVQFRFEWCDDVFDNDWF